MLASRIGTAGHASPAPVSHVATRATSDSDSVAYPLALPVSRPLEVAPPVTEVGTFPAIAGGVAKEPIDAAYAAQDLMQYAINIESLFPWSAEYYPADSIRRVSAARAAAWVRRLAVIGGAGIVGHQSLPYAAVAVAAENDSAAQRILDARLAETVHAPEDQSLTLTYGVLLFANVDFDDARLQRTFPVAERYVRQLLALPAAGYANKSDSMNVVHRKGLAMEAIVRASESLRQPAVLLAYVDRLLAVVPSLPFDLRYWLIAANFPYRAVAEAMLRQPNSTSRIDSLRTRLLAAARRRADEWPARIPVADRPAIDAREQQNIQEHFLAFDLIGHPAPPVQAHAWLNTADSAYAPTPRVHRFDDGVIRVIAFGHRDDDVIPVLDRVQRHVPAGVRVVFVTETEGHGGSELLTPVQEVAWINTFLRTKRHATFVTALWAGAKVPQEGGSEPSIRILDASGRPVQAQLMTTDEHGAAHVINEDSVTVHYQRFLPQPSPVPETYRLETLQGALVVVDGHGNIRGYRQLGTRVQEAELVRFLTALRAEAGANTSASAPSPVRAPIAPPGADAGRVANRW